MEQDTRKLGPKRTKKWATKTRTGCITCRRRRIKCDEGLPSCKRCISTGRECEGYNRGSAATAPTPATGRSPSGIMAVYQQPVQTNAPAGVNASYAERNAFAMLHGECVGRMAGLFSESFWTVDVMRATQVYPAIWHAGLAMAAMHRATCITAQTAQARESRQRNEAFALSQFNAAVLSVLELTKKPALTSAEQETVLLASTLFTSLSCLQEDYEQASKHAEGGNRLYWKWEYWKNGGQGVDEYFDGDEAQADGERDDDDDDDDTDMTSSTENYRVDNPGSRKPGCVLTSKAMTAVFTHFEMQFCSRFRTVDIPEWRWRSKAHKCSPAPFTSANDAYTEIQPLLAGYCHIGRYLSIPRDVAELVPVWRSCRAYVSEMLAWNAKFEEFLLLRRRRRTGSLGSSSSSSSSSSSNRVSSPVSDEEEDRNILALRLMWMAVETGLTRDQDTGELGWDSRDPDMERVTAFAEKHFAEQSRPGAPRVFTFSFAMSVCEVLTFVGTNCRDGGIRRRLIALLHNWRERDGLMDSRLLALVVQTVMVLEENATTGMQVVHDGCTCAPGQFICGDHRVCLIDTQFLAERSACIVLTTAGMLKDKLPPYETSVSW